MWEAALIQGIKDTSEFAWGAATTAVNNEFAKSLYKWQQEYNLKNYSPDKQMQRYIDAGINPNLVTGQTINPMGSPGFKGMDAPASDLTNLVMQFMNYRLAEQNNQSTISNRDAQTELTRSKKVAQDYQNENMLPAQLAYQQRKITEMDQIIDMNNTRANILLSDLKLKQAEAQWANTFYKFRANKMKFDSQLTNYNQHIRGKEWQQYRDLNIRPNDPYYVRMLTPIMDAIVKMIENKTENKGKKPFWKRLF